MDLNDFVGKLIYSELKRLKVIVDKSIKDRDEIRDALKETIKRRKRYFRDE